MSDTRAEGISLKEAAGLARTGDVWLFRGHTPADRAIRTLTNAPVNHVGMAVVIDDLPPLLWHAEMGKALVDHWSGDAHRGVQLHDLGDAVTRWRDTYGQAAWIASSSRRRVGRRRTGPCARSPAWTASRSPAPPASRPGGWQGATPTSRAASAGSALALRRRSARRPWR
ncbi:hypothetical protein [Nocardioides campestrisoli]|uniref:hypothetical protein n=1 Tax=Nocardioides campestrisoli TaxID=2736757 RepID=UPI00215A0B48|nr:hypothetical protein [Nocardioides campestrisoli]